MLDFLVGLTFSFLIAFAAYKGLLLISGLIAAIVLGTVLIKLYFLLAYGVSFAVAAADTWASEVGY